MLKIELRNEKGETVVHEQIFVSGNRVRAALKMQDEFDKNPEMSMVTVLDKMVEFAAGTFDDEKVNTQTILNGIEGSKLFPTLNKILNDVMGNEEDGLKEVAIQAQK